MRDCGGTNEQVESRNIASVMPVCTSARAVRESVERRRRRGIVGAVIALAVGGIACAEHRAPPEVPELPVVRVTSARTGPTLALVAGVHGGKVAAVHALEQLARELPGQLTAGTVLLVGPANLAGYRAGLAQTSPDDGLNLNRIFPGRVDGSPTERLAARLMAEIVSHSDYLIDLHGSDGDEAVGRFAYAARPGVHPRTDSLALGLALRWGVPVVVWDEDGPRELATSRFLQTAAHLSGVPAITVFESGATREDSTATAAFVAGAHRVLTQLGMLEPPVTQSVAPRSPPSSSRATVPSIIAPRRTVSAAVTSGAWSPSVRPGDRVASGELLGTLRDSSGVAHGVRAAAPGLVLHLRLEGSVPSGVPLAILAELPLPPSP